MGARQQTTEATSDDHDVNIVVQWRSLDLGRSEWIPDEPLVLVDDVDVLVVAIGTKPLVTLNAVLVTKSIGIETRLVCSGIT